MGFDVTCINVINEITCSFVVYLLSICVAEWMYDLRYRPTFIYRGKVSAGNRIWCVDYYYLNELFHPVPSKVIYCYGEYQKEFDDLHDVDFVEGFPDDLSELARGHEQTLLILDDLMSECSKDQRVSDLFTRFSP